MQEQQTAARCALDRAGGTMNPSGNPMPRFLTSYLTMCTTGWGERPMWASARVAMNSSALRISCS